MLKKKEIIFFSLLLSASFLCSCGKKDIEEVITEEPIKEIELSIEEDIVEKEITHEVTEAGKKYDEKVAKMNDFYYYNKELSTATINGSKQYTEEEVTTQFLVDLICNDYSDTKVNVMNFEADELEYETVYKNGVASYIPEDYVCCYLDLDQGFQNILNEQVTPLMQWNLVQSLANTIMKENQCNLIKIKSGDNYISTYYKNYTEEDSIEFNMNCFQSGLMSDEEIFISRQVERYRRDGIEITREDYLSITDESQLESFVEIPIEEVVEEDTIETENAEESEIEEETEESTDIIGEEIDDYEEIIEEEIEVIGIEE